MDGKTRRPPTPPPNSNSYRNSSAKQAWEPQSEQKSPAGGLNSEFETLRRLLYDPPVHLEAFWFTEFAAIH